VAARDVNDCGAGAFRHEFLCGIHLVVAELEMPASLGPPSRLSHCIAKGAGLLYRLAREGACLCATAVRARA
jgi:hypothetical protein